MDTRAAVKERIVELCKEKNLAFNALAIISGVHPSTVKGIINGASQNPGIVTIKKLCDGLDITLPEFFDSEMFQSLEQEIR
ncbi:MAG: helix-turn-helix domain-containing protein [Oscillospiraceae bacterium]|nr:helix-turn-helix domain-containing protein [Oscillospiraceae bacterium]